MTYLHSIKTAIFCIVFFVFVNQEIQAKDTPIQNNSKSSKILRSVYLHRTDSNNLYILKLYDDVQYEFLYFKKQKDRVTAKRETGTYKIKKTRLILKPTKGKTRFEHVLTYYVNPNKSICVNKKDVLLENNISSFIIQDLALYQKPFISDPIFGKISNKYKLNNKLNDPDIISQDRKIKEAAENEKRDLALKQLDSLKIGSSIRDSLEKISWQPKIKKLKAIIIVSDVDGDDKDGWWNKAYIAEQRKNAKYLREHGVTVLEFYHPNTKWKDIVKASKDANIFIYSGHGSNQGINHESGGLCLVDGIYGGDRIKKEIKLHDNALVIFNSACYSAGSS
jgi:hypothetical protein